MSYVGILLIAISVFGLVFVYIPLGLAEANYEFSRTQLATLIRNSQKQAEQGKSTGKSVTTSLPTEWAVPDVNYSIYIPKIFAISKVIPNVDAGNVNIYLAALKQGVAEAKGLSHPGEIGTTFLFAHSVGSRVDYARYNAVFYLLDKLTVGDGIEIVYQNKWYKYEITDKEVLDAADTKYLVPQTVSEKLVLQTCYPPGTSWRRLVVVANRI
jgi:LPXTG-site transpeptidase (sortase) family protein